MKLLFLKYMSNRLMGEKIRFAINENNMYIYDAPENLEEKVYYWYSEDDDKILQVLLLGYDSKEKVITEGWIGDGELISDESIRIKIDNLRILSIPKIRRIEELFVNSSRYKTSIFDVNEFLFMRELPQDILYDIIYDLKNNNLHSYRNESVVKGKYRSLNKSDIGEEVMMMEEGLHPLAQKSFMAKRAIGIKKPDATRSEFQRDRDRIIHSKSFRRTVDKAQVYNTHKGDHYRTRLTHTLEVSQIARGIVRSLHLNEDLAEAISLGHDIGHTPFGHEGERQLDLIMSGKIKLAKSHVPENFGGFKHNYQSLKLANYEEEKYVECEGLDLTYQVLEGILKHTKIKKCKENKCESCAHRCFDIDEFLIIGDKKYLYLDQAFPSTLEGQVVAWADEIAQRGHDLDDGIAGKLVNIYELHDELKSYDSMVPVVKIIEESLDKIEKSNRELVDKQEMIQSRITPKIISMLICDIVKTSRKNMDRYLKTHGAEGDIVIDEPVICFSTEMKEVIDNLEKIINQQVINSQEVNCFDGKSMYIIKKLFQAYYNNPKQLPDHTLKRIERDLHEMDIPTVDIRKDNKNMVNMEIQIFKGMYFSGNRRQDFIKQKIYMRNIADFIGGMTDNYANARFKELYNN